MKQGGEIGNGMEKAETVGKEEMVRKGNRVEK